jgi:hypothetical protein
MQNDEMSGLIVNALEMASEVGIQEAQVKVLGAEKVLTSYPDCPQFAREGQIYRSLHIVKQQDLDNLKLTFSYKNPRDNYSEITQEFDIKDFKRIESEALFQAAASAYIKSQNTSKEDKLKASLEYGVLSSETGFFGVTKRKGQSPDEVRTIQCELLAKPRNVTPKPRVQAVSRPIPKYFAAAGFSAITPSTSSSISDKRAKIESLKRDRDMRKEHKISREGEVLKSSAAPSRFIEAALACSKVDTLDDLKTDMEETTCLMEEK